MHKSYAHQTLSQKLVTLRDRIEGKPTQTEIAKVLGVSLTTLSNWETGTTSPKALNLRNLISLYLRKGAFTKGKELEEMRQLWEESKVHASFDEAWFLKQLEQINCPETVTAQAEPNLPAQVALTTEENLQDVSMREALLSSNTSNTPIPSESVTRRPDFVIFTDEDEICGTFIEIREDTPVQGNWQRQRLWEIASSTIRDLLVQMLRHTAYIRLELYEHPHAVDTPSHASFLEGIEAEGQFVPDILDMYDNTGEALLILGAPGSGKTFLLLELAGALLSRARQNENHPIPFILNLSSWALGRSRLPLEQWIIKELSDKYRITPKIGHDLIKNNQLLPLLDGLDETAHAHRAACIEAINNFHHDYSFLPTVVCSRSSDYFSQNRKLSLRGAVEVQPLAIEQIERYLANTRDEQGYLEKVRAAIHEDAKLRELASTPLMLSILTLAYRERPVEELLRQTPELRRQHVFTCYIDRMLRRRGAKTYDKSQQVIHWLSWLAQQMARCNQSEFYLERMQIDWLPDSWLHWLLPIIGVGLVYGLFFGIIKGINYTFLQGVDQHGRSFGPMRGLVDGILIGTGCTLIFVLLNSLLFWAFTKPKTGGRGEENGSIPRKSWWIRLLYGIVYGLLMGVIIGFLVDLPAGIYNGLFCSAIFAGLGNLDLEIRPTEKISWSWEPVRQHFVKFVGGGVLLGLGYGLLTGLYWQLTQFPSLLSFQKYLACLLVGLSIGLILGLLVVLAQGISHKTLEKQTRPNQGIWNSIYNSTLLGGSSCLLFGLFFGIIYGVLLHQIFHLFGVYTGYSNYFPKDTGLAIGLVDGLTIGAFFWLRNGGTACTLHTVLRILLWLEGYIPWNYPRFLDYATERILLCKVGGCYIFTHGLLLEHFKWLRTGSHNSISKNS